VLQAAQQVVAKLSVSAYGNIHNVPLSVGEDPVSRIQGQLDLLSGELKQFKQQAQLTVATHQLQLQLTNRQLTSMQLTNSQLQLTNSRLQATNRQLMMSSVRNIIDNFSGVVKPNPHESNRRFFERRRKAL
jgi:hypothetical protein